MWGISPRAWVSLVVGVLAELSTGGLYLSLQWDDQLQKGPGDPFSDGEKNLIARFGAAGQYLGFVCGILTDLNGVRLACICGAIMQAVGYVLMYVTSQDVLDTFDSAEGQGFCMFMITFGVQFIYISCVRSNAHAFPVSHRATIVGLMTGMFALSSTVLSHIYTGIFDSQLNDFQLFMAISTGVVSLIASFLLHPIDVDPYGGTFEPFLDPSSEDEKPTASCSNQIKRVVGVFLDKVKTKEFWILFASYFLGTGATFIHISNSESIIQSLTSEDVLEELSEEEALSILDSDFLYTTTVFSLASGFGALTTLLSDFLQCKRGAIYSMGMAVVAISFLVSAVTFKATNDFGTVYTLTGFIGFGYGIILAIALTILSEIWTTDNLGQNWGWLTMASISGQYFFNELTSILYEHQAHEVAGGDKLACFGAHCYRGSYYLGTAAAFVGLFVSFFLITKTERGRRKTNGFNTMASFTEMDER